MQKSFASETKVNISHHWGILRDEVRLWGLGKRNRACTTSFYRLAPWTPADVVRGRQAGVLRGFLSTASFSLSLTTSLSLFFLSRGQADLWLHMDDLEMLYALLWVFKRGPTVTKDETQEFIRVPIIFPPLHSTTYTLTLFTAKLWSSKSKARCQQHQGHGFELECFDKSINAQV